MAITKYSDWLFENSNRKFPFCCNSSFTTDDGVVMPDWMLLDFSAINISSDIDLHRINRSSPMRCNNNSTVMRLIGIERSTDSIYLVFSVEQGGLTSFDNLKIRVLTGDSKISVIRGIHRPADRSIPNGVGILYTAVVADSVPDGQTFNIAGDGLHKFTDCPILLPSRIISSTCASGMRFDASEGSTGDIIHIRDGNNLSVGIDNDCIDISAGLGNGTGADRFVKNMDTGTPAVIDGITMINGVTPDKYGNISIIGGTGVSVFYDGIDSGVPVISIKASNMLDTLF